MDLLSEGRAEAECARRAAGGDLEAMEMIYTAYKGMAYAVGMAVLGNPHDADEVVQETFLRAFGKLGQWRGEARLGTWLYAIALRTAQNWKSRFLARRPIPAPAPAVSLPAEGADERREEEERLLAAIRDLPEQQRLTLLLKHVRGLTIRQIAGLQGCAEGTVKANLHHALTGLARRLGRMPE